MSAFHDVLEELKKYPEAKLIAVSKLQPKEKIEQLYSAGQRDFAENYVQEFLTKVNSCAHLQGVSWHFIGHLQTNKVKMVVGLANLIHSVDSLRLAKEIDKRAKEKNIVQNILLQVNVSGEQSKDGFSLDTLQESLAEILSLSSIKILGLMTMPPLQNEARDNRLYFKKLKELSDELQKNNLALRHENFNVLSMGTSHDYQVALEEGATMIRLGTVLFGERPSS